MEAEMKRRNFLKLSLGAGAGTVALTGVPTQAMAALCGLTPKQTSGPFYPGESKFTNDNDLTLIAGHSVRAAGQVVYIKGQVTDKACKPLVNANVEIWQACETGKYNDKKDPNPAPIDPHFKYWGETFTDSSGNYMFKTIIPGAYPADPEIGWVRPPHIHFRIAKIGYKELITQMYFKGDKLNDKDLILQAIPENERDLVVSEFRSVDMSDGLEMGALIGTFNISVASIR